MIPVNQTIFCNKKGNCLVAVWASLLHKEIKDIPNFVEYDNWFEILQKYLEGFNLEYVRYVINGNREMPEDIKKQYEFFRKELPDFGDVNGFYEATVYSPRYFDEKRFFNDPDYSPTCHAVIVDKNYNVVHDPNPFYKDIKKYPLADKVGFNGVVGVSLWRQKIK